MSLLEELLAERGIRFVGSDKGRTTEQTYRLRYGKMNGHYKWDLAKAWLTMSNDSFYELYGFSWVPPSWMYEQAREFI